MLKVEGSLGYWLPLDHLTGEMLVDGIRDAEFEVVGVETTDVRHGETLMGGHEVIVVD